MAATSELFPIVKPGPVRDRATAGFLGILIATAIIVPILNLAVPESSALHISAFGITLIGKYMCYG